MENPDVQAGADAGLPLPPPPSLDSAGGGLGSDPAEPKRVSEEGTTPLTEALHGTSSGLPECTTLERVKAACGGGQGSPHPHGCYSFRAPRKLDAIKQVIMAKASSSVSRTRWLNLVGLVMLR
ncbi:hypothetical protein ZWY2020_056201 [Hordeum vulgare]|nr:hypothetical protein ZWY2020_056201 [Hordeum vulgare]